MTSTTDHKNAVGTGIGISLGYVLIASTTIAVIMQLASLASFLEHLPETIEAENAEKENLLCFQTLDAESRGANDSLYTATFDPKKGCTLTIKSATQPKPAPR